MKLYAPDYYSGFRCIADQCRHTCCTGWEIDIDDDTAQAYLTMPGTIGDRLRAGMAQDETGTWHFVTDDRERCPMLTGENLCSLITACGEEALCQICSDHPRFRNDMADRTEIGLGLCCEAAAGLILTREAPMGLILLEDDGFEDEADEAELQVLALRGRLLAILQQRGIPLSQRIQGMCRECGTPAPAASAEYLPLLLSLERLDSAWTEALLSPGASEPAPLLPCFDVPLEQLMAVLLYRHMPSAAWDDDPAGHLRLCILLWQLVRDMFAAGEQTMPRLIELARLMSSQLEYSDENLPALLQALS